MHRAAIAVGISLGALSAGCASDDTVGISRVGDPDGGGAGRGGTGGRSQGLDAALPPGAGGRVPGSGGGGAGASPGDASDGPEAAASDAAQRDVSTTPLDATLEAGDAGQSCGSPLGPDEVRPSSFVGCVSPGCAFGERCDLAVRDFLCDPPDACPASQSGDLRCHRSCEDGRGCAPGEECVPRLVYVSDTPAVYQNLCMCAGDAASCPPRDPAVQTAEGGLSIWRDETPLVRDLYYHSMAASDSWLVVSGGLTIQTLQQGSATLTRVDAISAARIGDDGRLGAWYDIGALPAPLVHHATALLRGRLYVAGGQEDSVLTSRVQSAELHADGTLSAFRDEANLPSARAWHVLATDGTSLVVAAGTSSSAFFTTGTDEIWLASLGVDGAIEGWTTVRAPSPVHYDGGAVVAGGVLYVVGQAGGLSWTPLGAFDGGATWSGDAGATPDLHVDFGTSGQHTLRMAALCDLLLFVVPGPRVATVDRGSDGALGAWHVASRFTGAGSGLAVASSPSGRVYASGGTGDSPMRRVDRVVSVARQ